MKRSLVNEIFTNPIYLTACGFGTGLVPKAPGTAGTLVAIPIVTAVSWLAIPIQWAIVAGMFFVGCFVCQSVADALDDHDPSVIVWDEIVGFCVAMILVPISPMTIIVGFVLFRLFDIYKPWPISWSEKKFSGGFGIMIDDVLSGVATNLCLQVLIHFNYI